MVTHVPVKKTIVLLFNETKSWKHNICKKPAELTNSLISYENTVLERLKTEVITENKKKTHWVSSEYKKFFQ